MSIEGDIKTRIEDAVTFGVQTKVLSILLAGVVCKVHNLSWPIEKSDLPPASLNKFALGIKPIIITSPIRERVGAVFNAVYAEITRNHRVSEWEPDEIVARVMDLTTEAYEGGTEMAGLLDEVINQVAEKSQKQWSPPNG